MRHIFLDTETTGILQDLDRIIEIAAIEFQDGVPSGREFVRRINPEGRPIAYQSFVVHRITAQDLENEPTIASVWDELIAFVSDSSVVIHNAPFDLGMLRQEARRAKKTFSWPTIIDTMDISRKIWPGKPQSLDQIAKRLGIKNSRLDVHSAREDCLLLGHCFYAMNRMMESGTPEPEQQTLFGDFL